MVSPITRREALRKTAEALKSDFEANQLLSHITGADRHELIISGEQLLSEAQAEQLEEMIAQRTNGRPLQYILGSWEFYSLPFYVGEGVLIPRGDTETMVDMAIELIKGKSSPSVIDLCSGSGAAAIAVEKNSIAEVTAVELSDKAYSYLERNIALNRSSVKAVKADVFCYSPEKNFTLVMSNPPYIPTNDLKTLQTEVRREPEMALDGGKDGLDFYRAIAKRYYEHIESGGFICFEIGINQQDDVAEILKKECYKNIRTAKDLGGITRVVAGEK